MRTPILMAKNLMLLDLPLLLKTITGLLMARWVQLIIKGMMIVSAEQMMTTEENLVGNIRTTWGPPAIMIIMTIIKLICFLYGSSFSNSSSVSVCFVLGKPSFKKIWYTRGGCPADKILHFLKWCLNSISGHILCLSHIAHRAKEPLEAPH